jgi:hypothetical protein
MSIQRGPLPADSFTIVSNAWLRDPRLSWKAKGLLAYIASHAPGHTLTSEQIHAEGQDGADAVRAGLRELEGAGYLRRVELRNARGHRTGTDFELCEPQTGFSQVGIPATGDDQAEEAVSAGGNQSGKSQVGKSGTKKTTSPKKTNEKTPSASPRGTRLPIDWAPSDELRKWFLDSFGRNGEWTGPLADIARNEHERFKDYWKAAPGQRGVKLDWEATWRNWMRKAMEGVRPISGPPASKPFVQQADEYKSRRARAEKAHGLLVDHLMETEGKTLAEALAEADEAKRAYLAQEPVASSSAVAYIEGVILPEDPKEVTGS